MGGAIGKGGGGGTGTGGGVTGLGGTGLGSGLVTGGGFGAGAGAMIESFTVAGVVAGASLCDIAGSSRLSPPSSTKRPMPRATAKRLPSASGFIQPSERIATDMKSNLRSQDLVTHRSPARAGLLLCFFELSYAAGQTSRPARQTSEADRHRHRHESRHAGQDVVQVLSFRGGLTSPR